MLTNGDGSFKKPGQHIAGDPPKCLQCQGLKAMALGPTGGAAHWCPSCERDPTTPES